MPSERKRNLRRPPGPASRRRSAFTLIEVLVSVSIIAVLVAVLLPALAQARRTVEATTCLSNLKQMATAAHSYTAAYGRYVPYQFTNPKSRIAYNWDRTLVPSPTDPARLLARPGLLWEGRILPQVNQCPSYHGASNDSGYPYSGYNYNTSYVGWCDYTPELDARYRPTGRLVAAADPARPDQIRRPAACAVFGDGEFAGGANKYMRSPLPGRDTFSGRSAGTQGFRHLKRTNIAFADGHAAPHADRFAETGSTTESPAVPAHVGFLSPDNRMYDLD